MAEIPALPLEITTDMLPIPTHLDLWRDLARRNFGFDMDVAPDCQGYLRCSEVGGALLHTGRSRGFHRLERGTAETQFGEGRVLMYVNHHGGMQLNDGGREREIRPGQLMLFDMEREVDTRFDGTMSMTGVVIDKKRLAARLRHEDFVHLPNIPEANSRLIASVIEALEREAAQGQLLHGLSVVESLLDMVGSSIAAADVRDCGQADGGVAARRALVLRHIDQNLSDPNLSPASIAAHFRMSIRYLHKLFEGADETVSQAIVSQRLAACRRTLLDSAQNGRSVSDIAYGWGFNDLSHFGRRFRQAYGLAPRELRDAAGT